MADYLSTDEVAALSGLHRQTVADALRDGSLCGFQRTKGGRWKVVPDCAHAWLQNRPCQHANVLELRPGPLPR